MQLLVVGAVVLVVAVSIASDPGRADTPEEVASAVVRDGYGVEATGCRLAAEHVSINEIWQCDVTPEDSEQYIQAGLPLEECFTVIEQTVQSTSCSYTKRENGGQPVD